MAEMRCPNCGRKIDSRMATGKNARCPKCGESLPQMPSNEPSQGWDKLESLLEGGGLAPLGASPAAREIAAAEPSAAAARRRHFQRRRERS